MRRNALALGVAVLTLALTAGPAAAEPGAGQTVDDSTGAAQVGAVAVDAPVRVASDGNSSAAGATAGGPQATGESTGAAQVTSVDADAPVRVLSDGDDAQSSTAASGDGPQATGDSAGSAQVGAAGVDAPVRVASDGDNSLDEGPGAAGSEQSVDGSSGSAQAGSPNVSAPVRAFSDGDTATSGVATGPQEVDGSTGLAQLGSPALFASVRALSGGPAPGGEPDDGAGAVGGLLGTLLGSPSGGGGDDVEASPATVAPTGPGAGGRPSSEGLRGLRDSVDPEPAVKFLSGGVGYATGRGEFGTLGVSAASLPLTGSRPLALMTLGLWLLSTGALASRLVPGGKRR